MTWRRLVAVASVVVALAVTASFIVTRVTSDASHDRAIPATYYVSLLGSDANPGSRSAPWQSIARVNDSELQPGDTVLFEGGATFSDTTLTPPSSGVSSAPITFGSYGAGRATVSNGDGAVWFDDKSDLVFDNLRLTTDGSSTGILTASPSGSSKRITIRNSLLEDTASFGVNIPDVDDADWTIHGNTFDHIGDSAIISLGARTVVSENRISDIGWSGLSYATHGVYAKGPDQRIVANDFSEIPHGQAVSVRFHGAWVVGNTIHDTPYAVAFFDNDTTSAPKGTSFVLRNRAWNLTAWFFYYSGALDPSGNPPGVWFVVASNTALLSGAREAMNVSEPRDAGVVVANNVFAGSFGSAFRGLEGRTSVHHNLWSGALSDVPGGTSDLTVAPGLAGPPALSALADSPVIDAGTPRVVGLDYEASCDGTVLSYCGSAPDIGAVESGTG